MKNYELIYKHALDCQDMRFESIRINNYKSWVLLAMHLVCCISLLCFGAYSSALNILGITWISYFNMTPKTFGGSIKPEALERPIYWNLDEMSQYLLVSRSIQAGLKATDEAKRFKAEAILPGTYLLLAALIIGWVEVLL